MHSFNPSFFLETPHEVHQLPIHRRSSGKFLRPCTRGLRGGGGGITTDSAVTPVAKPTITAPPVSQTVVEGTAATFAVTATSTSPLSYQWQKDGTDISGATSSTYTIAATRIADSGVFTVVVFNGAGFVISSEATLTVTAAAVVVATKPLITTHPAAQTVVTGTPASFSVSASGTAPLSYQWKKDGKDIAGATSNPYTIAAATMADGGGVFRSNHQ